MHWFLDLEKLLFYACFGSKHGCIGFRTQNSFENLFPYALYLENHLVNLGLSFAYILHKKESFVYAFSFEKSFIKSSKPLF